MSAVSLLSFDPQVIPAKFVLVYGNKSAKSLARQVEKK